MAASDFASAGLDLVGGYLGANAAKKAAAAQKRAAEQQGALQREQYYTALGMNDPYYLTGTGANNLQAQMWGLPLSECPLGCGYCQFLCRV